MHTTSKQKVSLNRPTSRSAYPFTGGLVASLMYQGLAKVLHCYLFGDKMKQFEDLGRQYKTNTHSIHKYHSDIRISPSPKGSSTGTAPQTHFHSPHESHKYTYPQASWVSHYHLHIDFLPKTRPRNPSRANRLRI